MPHNGGPLPPPSPLSAPAWWYTTADGAFPCADDGSCSAPGSWYEELARPLGPPLGDAVLSGTVYSRAFAHARVSFDAANASAAAIEWQPPAAAAAAAAAATTTAAAAAASGAAACALAPSRLTVDFSPAAVGESPPASFLPPLSDSPAPLLGWWLTPAAPGGAVFNASQSAYRVTVATAPALLPGAPDVWDSGVVRSPASVAVRYGGLRLPARARVFWRVEVWDGGGAPCGAGAETGAWEVPLLDFPGDWQGAAWIAAAAPPPPNASDCDYYLDAPAPLFRARFLLAQPPAAVVRARLYATGLGYVTPLLDGAQVGDEVLAPAWTNFSSSVLYSTFDVTRALLSGGGGGGGGGAHVLGLAAGNGWWRLAPLLFWGHLKFSAALPQGQPMVLALLAVDFADGSRQHVATGAGAGTPWAVGGSEVLFNSIYLGTRVERAREPVGWATPAFDAGGWAPPFAVPPGGGGGGGGGAPLGALRSQRAPPVRRQAPVAPTLLANASGEVTLDLGRQVAGVCDFRFSPGAPRGAAIHFRYGELLFANGSVNGLTSVAGQIKSGNGGACAPRVAWQEDHYVLRGDAGGETFTPRWTWHAGRYVMATGDAAALAALDVGATRCFPLRSDVAVAGAWRSSSPLLNAIHAADVTTMESNMMSVQSDCPHRERLGYGGDALMSAESFILNFDMALFYGKRLDDVAASQRPNGGFTETAPSVGMSDAGLGGGSGPIGWEAYLPVAAMWGYKFYGDDATVARVYPAAARYAAFLQGADPAKIEHGLGDWMTLEDSALPLTGRGFQLLSYAGVADMSRVVGNASAAAALDAAAANVTALINDRFLDAATGVYAAQGVFNGTQCGQAMPLFLGIVPPAARAAALRVLADNVAAKKGHLSVGSFGVKYLLMALADGGLPTLAAQVMLQEGFPGFGYMLNGALNNLTNATTIWESWFTSDNTFSHNHPMFTSGEVYFFEGLAGIRAHPAARGWDRALIMPAPPRDGSITSVDASLVTVRGEVAVSWQATPGAGATAFAMQICVPANMAADVWLPGAAEAVPVVGCCPCNFTGGW
jgi:alpha-L-rhamnosidase